MDAERVRVLERISKVVTDHRQYQDTLPSELAFALSIPYHGQVHNAISSSVHHDTATTTSTVVTMTKQEMVLVKTIVNHAMSMLNKWSSFFQNPDASSKPGSNNEQGTGSGSSTKDDTSGSAVTVANKTTLAVSASVATTSTSARTTRVARSITAGSASVVTKNTTTTNTTRARQTIQVVSKTGKGTTRSTSKSRSVSDPASLYDIPDPTYDHVLILVDLGFIALQALERVELDANKGFLDVHKARSNLVNKIISLGMKKRGMQELAVMRTQLLKAANLLWPNGGLMEEQSPVVLVAAHHAPIDPAATSILMSHQNLFCFPVPQQLKNASTAKDIIETTTAGIEKLQTFILLVNGLHNNAIRCWMDVRQGALTHHLDLLLEQPGMPMTWCYFLAKINPKASLGPLDAMLRLHFQAAEKITSQKITNAESHAFDIRMLGVQYLALQALVPGGRGQETMWKTMLSCGNQLLAKAPAELVTSAIDRVLGRFKSLLENIKSTIPLDTQLSTFKQWRRFIDTHSSKASNINLGNQILMAIGLPMQQAETSKAKADQLLVRQHSTPSPTTPETSDAGHLEFGEALKNAVGSARRMESVSSSRMKGEASAVELQAACQDAIGALSTLERCITSGRQSGSQPLDLKTLQNIARIFQSLDCIWSLASKSFDKSNALRNQIASTSEFEMDVETETENASMDTSMFFVCAVKPVIETMSRLARPLWQHSQDTYKSMQSQHERLLPHPSKLSSACVDALLFLFRLVGSSRFDDNRQAAHYLDMAHTIAAEMCDWESLRWISNAVYNLGGLLFKQGLHREAAVQINSCIQYFLTWMQSDAAAGLTDRARAEARLTLAKRYEILGICYAAQNKHKATLDALEAGLVTLPLEEYQKLHHLVIAGHTNHSELPMVAQLLDRRARTLLLELVSFDSFASSMALGELSPAPSLEIVGLIQEYESSILQLMGVKVDCRKLHLQHLQSIVDKTYRGGNRIQFPIKRARVLITLASFLQSFSEEKLRLQAINLASEAVEILKTKNLGSDDSLRNYQSHYLALAYTWLGILQQKLEGAAQKSKPFQIALQLWESILADVECFTTLAEASMEANRLKAQAASMMIADTEQLMCHLNLLADYLGMIGQQVMQVHVYMLILKLSNSSVAPDPRNFCVDAVRTYIKISQAYLVLGYSGKAKIALDQGKEILEELKRSKGDSSCGGESPHAGQGELYASWLLAYSLYMSSLGHKKQGIQAYNEATVYSAGQDLMPHNLQSGLSHADRRPTDISLSKSTELKVRKTMILVEASLARSYLQYNEGNLSEAIPDAMRSLRQLSGIISTLVKATERSSVSGPVKREPENPFLSKSSEPTVSGTGYQPQGPGATAKASNQQGSNSQLQKELEILAHQRHQWQVFRLVIETLHHLARLYLSQGCAREAEYFLQEGKAVAKLSRASWLVDRLLLKEAEFSLRKHDWDESNTILRSLTQRDDHTSLALDLQDACVQLCFGDLYHQTANLERSLRAYMRTDEILTHLMDKEFISKLEQMVIKEPQTPREKRLTHQVRTRSQKGSLLPQKSASQYECMMMSRLKASCGFRKALVQSETLQRSEAARTIEDASQVHPMAAMSIEHHHVKAKVLMMELQHLMSKHLILAMVPESVLGVGLVRRFVSPTSMGIPSSLLSAGASSPSMATTDSTSPTRRIARSARGASSRSRAGASTERQDGYVQVLQQAKWHLSEAYRLAIKGSPPHIVSDICTRQALLSVMESCLHQELFKGSSPLFAGGAGPGLPISPPSFVSPSRPTNMSTKKAIDQHYRHLASRTSFFLELSKGITQRRELYGMIRSKLYPTLPQEDLAWPSAITPVHERAKLEGTQGDENDGVESNANEVSIHVPGTRAKLLLQPMTSTSAFALSSEQKTFLKTLEQVYYKEQGLHTISTPFTPSVNPFAAARDSTSTPSGSLFGGLGDDIGAPDQFLAGFVDILPPSWTVVSLSMDVERETLYVNRLRAHTIPVILQLPLTRVAQRAADHPEPLTYDIALGELEEILADSNETLQSGQSFDTRKAKEDWWKKRENLDNRMYNLLQLMQNHWLCGLQGVIQSHNTPRDEKHLLRFKANLEHMMFLAAHSQPLPSTVDGLSNGTDESWPPETPAMRTTRRPARSVAATSNRLTASLSRTLAEHQQQQQQQDKSYFLEIDKEICRLILNLGDQPGSDELEDLIYFVLDAYQHHGVTVEYDEIDFPQLEVLIQQALVTYWLAETDLGNDGFDNGAHVILILDKHLQMFPWENLPVLRGEAVSRLPSIWFLRDRILRNQTVSEGPPTNAAAAAATATTTETSPQAASTLPAEAQGEDTRSTTTARPTNAWRDLEVDPSSAYYILNPGGDLAHTEKMFRDYVETQRGWDGVIGRRPLDLECVQGLSQSELYIYFGHSGGEQYIKSHQIRQLLPTRCAVSLLLGCSSGVLTSKGEFDPYGNVLNYILAGCPTVVANLWDVTDKDIDRFSKAMFTAWGLDKNRAPPVGRQRAGRQPRAGGQPAAGGQPEVDEQPTTDRQGTADGQEQQQQQRLSIVEAVKMARSECRMQYLVGAAPVVYGIPCFLKQ